MDGPTPSSQVKTIPSNGTGLFVFNSLANGIYTFTISLPDGRSASQVRTITASSNRVEREFLYINNDYTVQNISIAKDKLPPPTPATTSNYLRADGINILNPLPSTDINADLSDWRGAQAFNAVYTGTDSSLTAIYLREANTGKISFTLYPIGFSTGSVSVKIGNQVITKTIASTGTLFERSSLAGGTYSCSITDLTTSNKLSFNIQLKNSGQTETYNIGTINGTDIITF